MKMFVLFVQRESANKIIMLKKIKRKLKKLNYDYLNSIIHKKIKII